LLSAITLPLATNDDLLTNTVVELVVRGDGIVESTVLTGECGSKAMDEAALGAARSLVFEPKTPAPNRALGQPERGKAIFTWHVVAPVPTNNLTSMAP
jgi:hypothetical protein